MEATNRRTRWKNAFIYALVTTVMLLSSVVLLAAITGEAQRELAARVDRNAHVTATATTAIICILQLGVGPDDPPRTTPNVDNCISKSGFVPYLPNEDIHP